MSPILQNSLIIFALLVLSAVLIQLIISRLTGKGIILTFSALILGVVLVDSELAYILGQMELNVRNVILIFGPGILLTLSVITILFRIVVMPVRTLIATTNRLAQGDLQGDISYSNDNEIGQLAAGLAQMIAYQREITNLANEIARGNLGINVQVKSDQDELGLAFQKMSSQLNSVIQKVSHYATDLQAASIRLAAASKQSGEATNQITHTIQQVAKDSAFQAEHVTKTAGSVEQMGRAIHGVARGAQEQAIAVSKASQVAARIGQAIEQVTSNAQSVTRDSAEAARYSRDGSKTVKETITGMESIRSKVSISAARVQDMGARSEEIGAIVETIEDIASQTNLLALNAAIEAARAEGSGRQTNERMAQDHLVGVARMLAELLTRTAVPLSSPDLADMSQRLNVEALSISDSDGVVVTASRPELIGFRFPDDGKGQAAAFRTLLDQKNGVVVQPISQRDSDGKLYLFIGISRQDLPGIIQAGMPAQELLQFGGISRGFAVVADEVRKLAERSSLATKEIAGLIKGIQKTISEAVSAMKESASEVESGVVRANSAGEVLNNILSAAESVYKQAEEAGGAAAKVSAAASELVGEVDSVSAVIEENTAATEEMAANSTELSQAIEDIAKISAQNSAAVKAVSASTEKVQAQVEEVSTSAASMLDMARSLQQIVAQFKLK
ncbi:MAG: methyl-accepting chemotaxis protein [Chloroflexi bacterium]|nr:methyl-accepting chemotaxis protein [Chloroflexota bacterium]